jgi:hypothetical protein
MRTVQIACLLVLALAMPACSGSKTSPTPGTSNNDKLVGTWEFDPKSGGGEGPVFGETMKFQADGKGESTQGTHTDPITWSADGEKLKIEFRNDVTITGKITKLTDKELSLKHKAGDATITFTYHKK